MPFQILNFFCFNHFLVEWFVCLELLSCWMIHFLMSFSSLMFFWWWMRSIESQNGHDSSLSPCHLVFHTCFNVVLPAGIYKHSYKQALCLGECRFMRQGRATANCSYVYEPHPVRQQSCQCTPVYTTLICDALQRFCHTSSRAVAHGTLFINAERRWNSVY